jgi:hypothetical protein
MVRCFAPMTQRTKYAYSKLLPLKHVWSVSGCRQSLMVSGHKSRVWLEIVIRQSREDKPRFPAGEGFWLSLSELLILKC